MAGMMRKLSELARSPKGRELAEKAQRAARDPETKRKVEQVRSKVARRGR